MRPETGDDARDALSHLTGVAAMVTRRESVRCNQASDITEAVMAQKVTVSFEDDLDGSPASETMRFGLAGTRRNRSEQAQRRQLPPPTRPLHRTRPPSWSDQASPRRTQCSTS